MNKRLFFTGLFVILLTEAMFARISLASHHKAQIAFTSTRDGNPEIYVMDADGNNQIRLTNHPETDYQPSWSPDGGRIAFASNRNGGNEQIYVMDSNGKNMRRLTDGDNDWSPAWSPDGQRIAFHSKRDEEIAKIYLVAPDGSNLQRLAWDIPSWDIEAAWSPDSQLIAYVSSRENWGSEIYVMDADGRNQKRLTHNMVTERQPTWSPDGSKIVFSLSLEEDTTIAVMNADGTNQRNLTEQVLNGIWESNSSPAWSPDGQTIAYVASILGRNGTAVHLMTVDGVHLKRLSKWHDGEDYQPDWFALASLAVFPASKRITIWGKFKALAPNCSNSSNLLPGY